MSLALAAQHLAAKGRYGDSTLVHMTPGEVAGLQALAHAHGKKLTINPETGLPEAFSLKSLLPMIAGVALNTFLPGAGLAVGSALGGLGGAAGTGLLVGGGTALATGSLQKGLMAGLGAYGGAGLAGGLTGAGATQGLNAASAEATAAGQAEAAKQLADANMMAKYKALADGTPAGQAFTPEAVAQSAREFASDTMGLPGGKPFSAATQATLANPMRAGAEGLMTEEGRKAFMDQMGGLKGLGKYGLAALSPLMMAQSGQSQVPSSGPNPYDNYRFRMNPTGAGPSTTSRENTYFNPMFSRMAEGGSADASDSEASDPMGFTTNTGLTGQSDAYYSYLMGLPTTYAPGAFSTPMSYNVATPISATDPLGLNKRASSGIGYYDQGLGSVDSVDTGPTGADNDDAAMGQAIADAAVSQAVVDSDSSSGNLARGGLSSIAFAQGGYNLGDYSDGGRLLRGPGDGVSDSIPASIANKRPARLADGEFVVPARIVSELGNGSTEAGARKLYAMMDRVQKNRSKSIGKGKVAVNSRSEKLLPA